MTRKKNIFFKTIYIWLLVVIVGSVFFYFSSHKDNQKTVVFKTPLNYVEPLVIAVFDKTFSIQPVNARSADRVREQGNRIKYVDAYQSTDVVQTIEPYKLKEDIVLKDKNHPVKFVYSINLDQFDFRRDILNNLVFYRQGHGGDDLYRIFTIPAPFMIDANGKISSNTAVEAIVEDGTLTLIPDKNWLENAVYPVVLDPTIEINVLNIQSFPEVGGPWQVDFTTLGTEKLTITGLSHDNYHTVFGEDIEFVSLKCGDNKIDPVRQDNAYVIDNWSCDQTAHFVVTVLKPGKHHLQFNLGGVIADAYNDTETIRPNGVGAGATGLVVGCTDNYDCVDEASSDADTSYVYSNNTTVRTDTYAVPNQALTGEINSVTVYIKSRANNTFGGAPTAQTVVRTYSTNYVGGSNSLTTSYADYSTVYTTNPNTSAAWTWSEIDDMEIGTRNTGTFFGWQSRTTQVWAVIDYTPGGYAPTISSASDSPDPVNAGSEITFSVDWNDADAGENIKVKICKTNVLSAQNCSGGYWATSTSFTASDPATVTYTAQEADAGSQNYYAYVCDDGGACVASGSGTAGTFTVNLSPGAPSVSDTPDPTNPNRSVSFIVDWDDTGDIVKAKACKTNSLTSQNCDGGYWASSTDFTSLDPLTLVYDVVGDDAGQTRNYYIFTCDDDGGCSSGSSGTFTVNSVSIVPNVKFR